MRKYLLLSILVHVSAILHSVPRQYAWTRRIFDPKAPTNVSARTSWVPPLRSHHEAQPEEVPLTSAHLEERQEGQTLIRRSVVVSGSCVTTWLLVNLLGVPKIRASGLQALFACFVFSPPFAAASLCGSFAGMSSMLTSTLDATLLGLLTGATFYWWETGVKIGAGRGGRLGAIAFLANVIFFIARSGFRIFSIDLQAAKVLRPSILSIIGSTFVLRIYRRTADTGTDSTGNLAMNSLAKLAVIAAIAGLNLSQLRTSSGAMEFASNALSILLASFVVKKSPGSVLPVALVGIAGSFLGYLSSPLYLGAMMGLTSLKNFGARSMMQTSTLAALIFGLGLLHEFAGRLGLFAFLSVCLWAM